MSELQREVLEQLGAEFALALEGMLGERWEASRPEAAPTVGGAYLCWSQKFGAEAEIQVAAAAAEWREVGRRALQGAGLEEPEEGDIRAAWLELLTQALSGLARFLAQKAGTEVTLSSGREAPMPARGVRPAGECLRMTSPSGFAVDLFVFLEAAEMDKAVFQRSEAVPAAERGGTGKERGGGGEPASSMDMLLDVEMPVSISFGRTQLPLREVVKLSTGSIIELNRTISEPVEVIVNNCVVARGEVVVVEGNYGVRIQQIISRSDRLRSVD